jgi:hypothetical protein
MKTWHQADAKPVTVEFLGHDDMGPSQAARLSTPIQQAGNASLARQLANDEPKCANCGYWSQARLREEITHVGDCILGSVPKGASLDPLRTITTDLSVCSAWTKK